MSSVHEEFHENSAAKHHYFQLHDHIVFTTTHFKNPNINLHVYITIMCSGGKNKYKKPDLNMSLIPLRKTPAFKR